MKKIGVFNKKGGVGKTFTAVTLASALTKLNKKVLLVDFDKQRNSNTLLGVEDGTYKYTIYNAMQRVIDEDDEIDKDLLVHTVQGIDIIAGSPRLAITNQILASIGGGDFILKKVLKNFEDSYDFCIFDCNPSDVCLANNMLNACDSVIIPVEMDYLSAQATAEVMSEIKKVQKFNENLQIEGILYNKVQANTKVNKEYMNSIRNNFSEVAVFESYIPMSIDAKNACDAGINIIDFKKSSKISKAFLEIANEIIGKEYKK